MITRGVLLDVSDLDGDTHLAGDHHRPIRHTLAVVAGLAVHCFACPNLWRWKWPFIAGFLLLAILLGWAWAPDCPPRARMRPLPANVPQSM